MRCAGMPVGIATTTWVRLAEQVAALWQLGMQQLVASRDAESALRQEARRKQRAFVAGLRDFGWRPV